jgi:uncharacterized protein YfaS (alpha-2-macroglobulin family)
VASAPVDQAIISGRPVFWWKFNLDVSRGKPDEPPGVISPVVPGRWKWDDPRTLTFRPDAALPKATALKLTLVPQRLQTADGFALRSPYVTSIWTERLNVIGVRQLECDEQNRLVLEIEFNDEVIPAEALSHVSVTSSDGHAVAFHPHGEAAGRIVSVMTDPVPAASAQNAGAYVRVQVSPGLTGRSGPLGLADAYQCNLPIATELVATEASAYLADHSRAVLSVRFNNPLDLSILKPLISVEPSIPFTLSGGASEVELHGAFQPATRYAIKIAKAPTGVRKSACPRPDTLSVYVPDVEPSFWFEHEEGYLGTQGNRTILAHAVNVTDLRASAYRVYDNNLVAWRNAHHRYWQSTEGYSRPIATRALHLSRQKNITQDVRISLEELLPADAPRDGVYVINLGSTQATGTEDQDDEEARHHFVGDEHSVVVTLSDTGLTAKRGRTALTVWATSLRSARPLSGVRVRVYSNKNQLLGEGLTDGDGCATITPQASATGEEPSVILADRADGAPQAGRDLTWLDLRVGHLSFGEAEIGGATYLRVGYEAFIYTDRGVYRPGETVQLRAIVRGPDSAMPASFPVAWKFRRPDLHDWRTVAGQIDADGAVSLELPLPDDLPTGRWSASIGLPGQGHDAKTFGNVSFQVEDFLPNRMQVGLTLDGARAGQSQRLAAREDAIRATVQADYLFGKPVTGRPAHLVARIDPAKFAPAGWDGWTFNDEGSTLETLDAVKLTGHRVELPEEVLDDRGHSGFEFDLDELLADLKQPATQSTTVRFAGPWRLSVTASVIETGGRAASAFAQADVDAVSRYVGIRDRSESIVPGSVSNFEIQLAQPNGQPATENTIVRATLFREDWNTNLVYERGRYVYQSARILEPVQPESEVRLPGGKGTVEVRPTIGGSYVLRVRDPKTGALASLSFYAGQDSWQDNVNRQNPERLELIVQPASPVGAIAQLVKTGDFYGALAVFRWAMAAGFNGPQKISAGGTARVIVKSPFAGRLLLTIETDDLVSRRVVEMPQPCMSLPIDINDACRPNAYVTATVIRAVDPNAPWQTHRAFGTVRLPVDNSDRKLSVAIESPPEIRPQTTLTALVHVTDDAGRPAPGAALTIAAVDEGICQLTAFNTPDPLKFFTRQRALGVEMADLFDQLMPEVPNPDKISAVGGDGGYDPRHVSPIPAKRVKPVALVSGVLHTDADGLAQVNFQVPQFTGKLRLMVVVAMQQRFGSAQAATLVRSPLLVQSSWPRFAAPGDQLLAPLAIFNNSSEAGPVSISLHADDGPLRFGSSREISVTTKTIPAGGQETQWVQVTALPACGVSRVSLTATMGSETYTESVELPVRPPSSEVTLGGFAVATPDKSARIPLPRGMLAGTSRLEVKVTAQPLLQLPQGLDELDRYPYGCLEQTTSTLFPLVYLPDIGARIAPAMFEKERVERKVQAGITRLIGMQTATGGLSMWPGYREPWPWGSVYAAHFLIEAAKAGQDVPQEFRRQLLAYVRNLLNQSGDDPEVLSTQAYACYVLALAGTPERAVMSRLADVANARRADKTEVPGDVRFHLAAGWLAAGRRDLAEGLIPQILPQPTERRSLSGSLASPVRERAILVNTLLDVEPDHPGSAAMVQQLSYAGAHHNWRSTQDTAFAVLALGRYLRKSRFDAPYESVQLLTDGCQLADAQAGQALLWSAGEKDHPMPPDGAEMAVRVAGDAKAKAHVSWLIHGVPMVTPGASDNAMTIRRRLLDERGQPIQSGRVHSGDLVEIELSITSPTALENLVIEDLLPAGLEIENPRLRTTASDAAEKPESEQNAFRDSRVDMRDDRLVVMGSLLRGDAGTFVYTARAVTAGTFVLPPVHAECMYDNQINSTSATDRLDVVPAIRLPVAGLQQGD